MYIITSTNKQETNFLLTVSLEDAIQIVIKTYNLDCEEEQSLRDCKALMMKKELVKIIYIAVS